MEFNNISKLVMHVCFSFLTTIINNNYFESISNPGILKIGITNDLRYCIVGKFGEFGESSMIRQTKTIQISTYN